MRPFVSALLRPLALAILVALAFALDRKSVV